jgi:hypothetical protein
MSIAVVCRACQTRLKAPDGAAGKAVRCPQCAEAIRVPAGAPDEEEPPPKVAAKPARRPTAEPEDEEDEVNEQPTPPRKKKRAAEGEAAEMPAIMRMTKFHFVPNAALIRRRKMAFLKDPESGEDLGTVVETTFKVLGNSKLLGIGPFKIEFPAKFELREGGHRGPALVGLRVARRAFRFQLGTYDLSALKYVVSTADGDIGTFVVPRNPRSPNNAVLGADGERVGQVVWDLKVGRRVVMVARDGSEFGHVIGERSIENEELLEEAKRTGKAKVKVEMHSVFNPDKRGSYAVVHGSRVGDAWTHAMVLAFGVLVQGAGVYAAASGAKEF